jgi:hypothetical protein
MKQPFLAAALSVLAVSNAFVLLHVGMNRQGAPEAELDLTARELSRNYARGDDSRVSLMLRWENTAPEYPEFEPAPPIWFHEQKLKETGFTLDVPPDAKDALRHYQNSRSREVFVALEFDGPAWQQWLRQREDHLRFQARANPQLQQEARIQEQIDAQQRTASRLVAIDAGLDPDALRRKYPDRKQVLILRGLARVVLEDGPPAHLRGAITQISSDAVNVPMPFSELLSSIPISYDMPADSYAVTLRVGQRYEPWIADLKRSGP